MRRPLPLVPAALVAAALALAAPAGAGTLPAEPRAPLAFPRDHEPHPGYGVEWWYTTGLVRDASGRRYATFFTVFNGRLGAVAVSHVVDLDAERVVHHAEDLTLLPLGPGPLDERIRSSALAYEQRGRLGRWQVRAGDEESGLELALTPTKPYVLHGGDGIVAQGGSKASAYYSATRMRSRGTLTVAGRTVSVQGGAWLDRQWGNFHTDSDALRWDWFSCRFADRSELMLYAFVDEDLEQRPDARTGTFVRPDGTAVTVQSFTARPLGATIRPRGSPVDYPFRWRLRVPSLGLRVRLEPIAREQYVPNRLVASFWEGAATARGTHQGVCFVEVSREADGFAERLRAAEG